MDHTHTGLESKIHERRLKIADLRRRGYTHKTDVARELHISRITVARDWAAIDEWWRQIAAQDVGVAKGRDAEILDKLIGAIIIKALDPEAKSQNFYIDRVIALIDRKAKLLGMDAPTKVNIVDDIRRRAIEEGLDPEAAIIEATRIIGGVVL
jgi:hypothetical protein